MLFHSRDHKSVVDAVRDQVRELILQGKLAPGSRLPAEKELIQQLNVSRPALREALHRMVGEGLLEIRPGSGTFVREPSTADAIKGDVVQLLLMSDGLAEIQEVRRILEPEIAARAARHAGADDLAALHTTLDRFAARLADGEDVFEPAWAFHRALAQVAGNAAMAKIIDVVYEMIRQIEQPLYARYFDHERELAEHRDLLEIIIDRDPERARAAMRRHLEVTDERLAAATLREQAASLLDSPPDPSPDQPV